MPFEKIGLAITFSPTGKELLKVARKLKSLFNSELLLLHIGKKDDSKVKLLNSALDEISLKDDEYVLKWLSGEPAKTILSVSKKNKVDLLIAGALEKEKHLKYYIGSVARKIMRGAECSVLIVPTDKIDFLQFKKFIVTTDYSSQSEVMIKTAFEFAKKSGAEYFEIVREFEVPGLEITVVDSGSMDEVQKKRNKWLEEEREKLQLFINELDLKDLPVRMKCLYGKKGWALNQYVKETGADILVIPAPKRKPKFFDLVFTHDFEFTVKELPSPLLIVKS